MDPNANLQEQEELLTQAGPLLTDDQERLAELRNALNHWLRKGGFEPDWAKAPHAACAYGRDYA